MYNTDRVYKKGYKERITVYEFEDLIESEKIALFSEDKNWDGASKNYRSYLRFGINKTISTEYRVIKKKAIEKKILKLFFKMLMQDILDGAKVKFGTRSFLIFIGRRAITSPKYKYKASQQGIDYIPYVKASKLLTQQRYFNLMFLFFGKKYDRLFKRELRNGKKYSA